ncbi:MAG TPA: M20/M25/M40 family metallo-hydrolase [Pyrinomonadaceae bacterium]|nr:M20/M25/M40 family metallo-hydrolase [Pyrinomonadaceae bacterium]
MKLAYKRFIIHSGVPMRRFVATLTLITVLIPGLSAIPLTSAVLAQRKTAKTQKTTPTSAVSQRGTDTITAAQMKDFLSFISSDLMEGRDTPSRGLDLTAQYLASNLPHWGFKPGGDNGTYFQKIALSKDLVDKAETKAQLNNQPLVLGEDYIPFARSGEISGPMVFAGNGWFVKSKNIDGHKGIDAKGKIVIVFAPPDGLPRGISRSDLAGKRGEDWMEPSEYAKKQGAIGLVFIPDFQYMANWTRNWTRISERGATTVQKFQPASGQSLPGIVIAPRVANVLFQAERQNATSLFEAAYGGQSPEPFPLNPSKTLSVTVKNKFDAISTQNVVAIFEGSDPLLKEEYVALGAHYDHVGIGPAVNGDSIFNGADDDGSGTTALLAMAEALGRGSIRPKRSVLFVWHAGEEKGLWGSRYFTEYPTIPLDKIVAQLNIDMIGRSKKEGDTNPRNNDLSGPTEVYVIGSKMMSTELGELTETVNKQYLNLSYNFRYDDPADPNRFFFRSDHYNYARKGIPIVFFFDGVHEDYHRPGDEVQKIDFQKMEKVTRTVYMMLWEIASRPARLKVDKQLPASLGGN